MAVLKDLIVHGSSRFLNTSYFNQLKTDKIGAEEGIFNKIVATTGDIGSLTVDDLTAGKATVLSLLDVRGELHTNQWTNSNIATIDGSFYITPTIGVPSGTMTTTANSVVVNGSNFPISSLYVNVVNSDNTATTVAWTSGSKVLVTGEILVNGVYMPLGTLIGTLSANATASQIQIGSITDNRYQTAASLAEIGTQSTALPCRNVKVSLYQTSRSSTLYPLGIFMTALGENGKTFLDIYGGGYATSTATAGGFAKPVLRIGNLAGLPAVGGSTPTGYGIYTSNGYFSGAIVAKKGKIGDGSAAWTIGNDTNGAAYIYTGTQGSNSSAYLSTGYGTISIADSGTLSGTKWAFTAGSNFGVTTNGTLYAKNAQISGSVAATNGFTVTSAIGGATLASMTGSGITLGQTASGKFNILITDSAVSGKGPGILLRQGTNVLNEIGAEGMNLYDSNANHLLSITPNKLEYIPLSSDGTTFFFKRNDESKYCLQNSLNFYSSSQQYNMITTNSSYTFSNLSSLSSGTPIIIATATYHKLTDSSTSDWTPSGISYLIFNKNTSKTATLFSINDASISVAYNGNTNFSFTLTNGSVTFVGYGPNVLTTSLLSAPSYGHIGREQSAGIDKLRGNHSFSMNSATARGAYSCAINSGEAFGDYSFAAGLSTAAGYGSTAFGVSNISYGSYSFVAGHESEVFKHYGVAIGRGLKSINYDQTVFGKYNKLDTNAMFIIGNGTANDARSNLMTVGNTEVTIGNQDGGHTIISASGMNIYAANGTIELANIGYGLGTSQDETMESAPFYTLGHRVTNSTIGNYSVAEGVQPTASGYGSHAEGAFAIASGFTSHAEGLRTTAGGAYSHAEGIRTTASGAYSHAEGSETIASGFGAHAEGQNTTASGERSHTEGENTVAEGHYSHAGGNYTIANAKSQMVIGEYNEADTTTNVGLRGSYAFIIGNGTAEDARSNALTVDWNGNVNQAGRSTTSDMTSSEIQDFVDNLQVVGNGIVVDYIVDQGTSSIWTYRKWSSGIAECWGCQDIPSTTYSANGGYRAVSAGLPSGLFINTPNIVIACGRISGLIQTDIGFTSPNDANTIQTYLINRAGSATTQAGQVYWNVKGRWK